MELLGVFLVSPLWGILSPRLFLKGWLSFLGVLASLIFLFQATSRYKDLFALFFRHITIVLFCFAVLTVGFYIFYFYLPFGTSNTEVLVYWAFSTAQLAFILPSVSLRIDQMLEQAKTISSSAN